MRGTSLLLIVLATCLVATGCSQAYIDKIIRRSVAEYRHQEANKSILERVSFTKKAHAAMLTPTDGLQPMPEPFPTRYFRELLALASLLSLWLICRLDYAKRQRPASNLDAEDLALISMIKNTAIGLWNKHNSRRRCKIIDLTTWRKK